MMSGDNSTDGFRKTRPVLGDVTNRQVKRAFSVVSGNLAIKTGDGYGENVDDRWGDSQFAKQVCLEVENLVKEKCRSKCLMSGSEKGWSSLKGKQSSDSLLCASRVDSQRENIKKPSNLSSDSLPLVRGEMAIQSVMEVGDASRDSCVSSASMPTCSGPSDGECYGVGASCQEDAGRIGGTQNSLVPGASASNVCKNNGKDLGIGNLASSKCGSIEDSRLGKSQGSKFFELERCTGLKGDGSFNSSEAADFLKACSCPFCLKAAYILSDLHYQDIKGRIAALKKSQKEASNLVQRSCKEKETNTGGYGNSNKSSKLESDLMCQWKSLFLHMEDIFVRESSQLQASYITLKDLRENCKTNLEMVDEMPLDKQ
ncbi:hypothetical protein L1049_003364 [Liquidambar formosana]|uniref:Uncharacterized protein n=1 Tax=Liquidambar formosana TaxID=63359 RepID=A0AAP0R8R8_LIQFO